MMPYGEGIVHLPLFELLGRLDTNINKKGMKSFSVQVRLWNPENGEPIGAPMCRHSAYVSALAWQPLHSDKDCRFDLLVLYLFEKYSTYNLNVDFEERDRLMLLCSTQLIKLQVPGEC